VAVFRFIVLTLLAASAPVRAAQVSAWLVDSLIKVFQDDPPGKNRAPDKACLIARNGHASLQIALQAGTGLSAVEVSVKLAGGLSAQVRRVGYIPVRSNPPGTPADEFIRTAPWKFPDPLFEDAHFALPANQTTAVWITVYAPASTRPGLYKGESVFRSGREILVRVPVQLRVSGATVPVKQTLKVTNWFNLEETTIGRYYAVAGSSERYWQLVGNIGRVLADHKQNVILTPVFSLAEPHLNFPVIEYDFSKLDFWVETFRKAGTAELIEGSHLIDRASGYNSPLTIPAFIVQNGVIHRAALDADDPRAEAHLRSFLPALYAHLKEKGWLGSYVQHVLDEAHGSEPPVYLHYVDLIRKALPGVPTIDAIDQTAGLLGEACDIWVPQLGKFDDGFEAIRTHVKKGGQAWFYTCLYPQGRYLNRFIDYPLLKTRLLHWFNFRYDFTGFLHWGGNYWASDPFGNAEPAIEDGKEVLPAGDAFITYPWREKNSIHSSIRLETMRDGIEDYELLRALASTNPDEARLLAHRAVPEVTGYIRDVAAFRALEAELFAALDQSDHN
jgi:hypothetical protein